MAAPRIRLHAPVMGREGRVEVMAGGEWLDISNVVAGATARVCCDSVTSIDLDVVMAAADVEGFATDDTTVALQRLAGAHDWRFPRAPRCSHLDWRVAA